MRYRRPGSHVVMIRRSICCSCSYNNGRQSVEISNQMLGAKPRPPGTTPIELCCLVNCTCRDVDPYRRQNSHSRARNTQRARSSTLQTHASAILHRRLQVPLPSALTGRYRGRFETVTTHETYLGSTAYGLQVNDAIQNTVLYVWPNPI